MGLMGSGDDPSGLTYELYSGGGPSSYIYYVVCYRVIAIPHVRNVVSLHNVTLLITIWNDQWTMNIFPPSPPPK